jgi:hypothetical protein
VGTTGAASSAAMTCGANNRTRCAIVVSPIWSSHSQNALCTLAMCAMNPACWPDGSTASPGGTKYSPTSRITMVSTASSPAPSTSMATTV